MLDFSDQDQLTPVPRRGGRLVDFVAMLRSRADAMGAIDMPVGVPLVDATEQEVIVWLDGALEEIGPPRRVEADMVGPGRVCFTVSGLRGATSRLFDLPGAGQLFGDASITGSTLDTSGAAAA